MLLIRISSGEEKYDKGFTLIELIIVIFIVGILSAIIVPGYSEYIKKAEETACDTNSSQLERMYQVHLESQNIEHTDAVFEQFLQEYDENICPDYGIITYVEGQIECSVHTGNDSTENNGEEVPFL